MVLRYKLLDYYLRRSLSHISNFAVFVVQLELFVKEWANWAYLLNGLSKAFAGIFQSYCSQYLLSDSKDHYEFSLTVVIQLCINSLLKLD